MGSNENFIMTLMSLQKYDCGTVQYTAKCDYAGSTEPSFKMQKHVTDTISAAASSHLLHFIINLSPSISLNLLDA